MRNKPPSHTNWWANKLQVLLPGRMNLATGKIVNRGAHPRRVQKLQSSVNPQWEQEEQSVLGGTGRK